MRKWILTIALTCAIAQTALAANSKLLLQHATKIKTSNDHFVGGALGQSWISDTQFLHFGSNGTIHKYDIRTRKDTPLRPLTQIVKGNEHGAIMADVSPNGKFVLGSHSLLDPFFVASLDGSYHYEWHGNDGVIIPNYQLREFWCADSKHWIKFHSYTENPDVTNWFTAQVHAIPNAPSSDVTLQVPAGLSKLEILAVQSDRMIVARVPNPFRSMTMDEFPASERPKSIPNNTNQKGNIFGGETISVDVVTSMEISQKQTISVWNLHAKKPLHTWTITLPGLVEECAVSPHADRIAWTCSSKSKRSIQSLWVSRLDGSHLTLVGNLPPTTNNSNPDNLLSQVTWLPSGTQLSFLYHHALWTVPVPQ